MFPANNIHPDLMPDSFFIWTYWYWNIESYTIGYIDRRPCIVDELDDDVFSYSYEDYN